MEIHQAGLSSSSLEERRNATIVSRWPCARQLLNKIRSRQQDPRCSTLDATSICDNQTLRRGNLRLIVPRTARELIEKYRKHVHDLHPFLEESHFHKLDLGTTSFMLAIGEILTHKEAARAGVAKVSGLYYFYKGQEQLQNSLQSLQSTIGKIRIAQMYLLCGFFYGYNALYKDAIDAINQAASITTPILLSEDLPPQRRLILVVAQWTYLHLKSELDIDDRPDISFSLGITPLLPNVQGHLEPLVFRSAAYIHLRIISNNILREDLPLEQCLQIYEEWLNSWYSGLLEEDATSVVNRILAYALYLTTEFNLLSTS